MEKREITLHSLNRIADTLRMVSNTLHSTKRETCLDRCVMKSWNEVVDLINQHIPSTEESIGAYLKIGQSPEIKIK